MFSSKREFRENHLSDIYSSLSVWMNSYPRFSYFSSDFSEILYVNIHIVPLSKCESFEIRVKNSEKGSLLYWWKATQRRPNIDGVNEITLRRVL